MTGDPAGFRGWQDGCPACDWHAPEISVSGAPDKEIEFEASCPACGHEEESKGEEAIHGDQSCRETVREVKIEDAELTVHIPTEYDDIHEAIEEALGARWIDGYTIRETYEVEEW